MNAWTPRSNPAGRPKPWPESRMCRELAVRGRRAKMRAKTAWSLGASPRKGGVPEGAAFRRPLPSEGGGHVELKF